MSYLKVTDLRRSFGEGESRVDALRGVSFELQRGEFVAIMGPSGSGKSTLMHLLGGVDRPTSGSIELEGVSLESLSEEKRALFRRRQIGLVYQFYNLVPLLTVRENIALPLLLDGRSPAPGQLEKLAETLELSDKLDAYPHQLSGGQQQRAGIGRALIELLKRRLPRETVVAAGTNSGATAAMLKAGADAGATGPASAGR